LLVHVDATGKTARQRVARDVLMAAPAPVPRLINALIDGRLLLTEETNNQATVTLTHEALIEQWPALHSWLEHNRAEIQQIRIHLLLLKAAASEDRKYAIEALKKYGPSLPEVIPALRAVAFYDEDVNIRWAAGKALGSFTWKVPGREKALEIISTLTEAFLEENANIRQAAAWALGEVNRAVANEAIEALKSGLNDPDKSVSKASLDSLRKMRSMTTVSNLSHSVLPNR
jgi:HEAT repeat protein